MKKLNIKEMSKIKGGAVQPTTPTTPPVTPDPVDDDNQQKR